MKKLIAVLSLLITVNIFAATPFTVSGNQIAVIFNTPSIWKNVFGTVNSISFVNYIEKTSTFLIKTEKCSFTVEVTDNGDDMVPAWEVTRSTIPASCKL